MATRTSVHAKLREIWKLVLLLVIWPVAALRITATPASTTRSIRAAAMRHPDSSAARGGNDSAAPGGNEAAAPGGNDPAAPGGTDSGAPGRDDPASAAMAGSA